MPTTTVNALAYADAKARLNLFEASLMRNPYNATPGATGLRDLDRAYGRIIGHKEALLFARVAMK